MADSSASTASTATAPAKAQKSCLNCRERKIACDRSLPTCATCKRRKKVCSGYDLNLSWPREGDKRRAATAKVRSRGAVPSSSVAFLNTSCWDTSLNRELSESGVPAKHMGSWAPVLAPIRPLGPPRFGSAFSPINNVDISSAIRMITSRGDLRQDVCCLLFRMSLSDNSVSSLAVRHSMNAISYLYLQKPTEALYHHMQAVSALHRSVNQINQEMHHGVRSQALAASMLLSLYEAVDRTGSTNNWSMYMEGCIKIAKSGHRKHRTYQGDDATLLDWVFYHNVLYKFSIQHWLQRSEKLTELSKCEPIISKAPFSGPRYTILGTLGCSLELLEMLYQTISLIRGRDDPEFLSKDHQQAISGLERRLRAIDQRLCCGIDNEEYHSIGSRKHYTVIARLFQLAIVIYLDRVARGSSVSSPVSRAAAKEAFGIMKDLGVCERPLPLFLLSIQAESDADRLLMLNVIQRTIKERPLSNLTSTERMIRRLWAQQDLQGADHVDALSVLNAIVSANDAPPSFT